MSLSAEDAPRQSVQASFQPWVLLHELLVLQVHFFQLGSGSLVALVELLKGRKVIIRAQQPLPFNAENLRDAKRLVRDALIELQKVVQLRRRQEIPVGHRAPNALLIGMVGKQTFFDLGIHAPVDTTDALHQPHRVPMKIVIDEAGRILKVQALGEHVRRNQNPCLLQFGGLEFRA